MADNKRSLRVAVLSAPWEGFLTAPEIAARLGWRWPVATVAARLRQLAAAGLLWSITEADRGSTRKFAHVRAGTADMIIHAGRRPVRRGWTALGRIAA